MATFVTNPSLSDAASLSPTNPFATPSTLPFQAPPFDKIEDAHYLPAIEAGMAQQRAEIDAIADSPAEPTFENTLVAMERSGLLLTRVLTAFGAVTGANTNPTLQDIKTQVSPRLAAHHDAIYLNANLFQRVSTLYHQRQSLNLDPESLRLLETSYDGFIHSGSNLSDADKTRLKQLNEEASTLSTAFLTKVLAAAKESLFVTQDPAALDGLSEAQLAAAAELAKSRNLEGWALPLQNTTQQPTFDSLTNRETRKAIFDLSWSRTQSGGANDTLEIIARLAQLRAERATILGFPTFAAWKLHDQMAKTPEAAQHFLSDLVKKATALIAEEAKDLQALIDSQGGGFQLQPWDWSFYAEQLRKARFDLDEEAIKPYFELNAVLEDGVFYAASQLFGITFKERHDIPVYHPSVRVFEITDTDGQPLSLFYSDPFKRDNKNGGAWMSSLVSQSRLLGTLPVIYNVGNVPPPAPGQPALLTLDEVTTFFHEFGHALHGLLSNAQYPSLAGTAVARDFVEFPSQFNEYWSTYPAVFDHFARHHATGEPMPADLAEKIRKAKDFNKGYHLTEVLASSLIDMRWHTLAPDAPLQDPNVLEAEALAQAGLNLPYARPRYRSTYFAHIWGGGYAAGYYAYQWAETLENEAIAWFESHGGLTRENGDRLRNMVLSRGNTEDLAQMFSNWIGTPPEANPTPSV
ncbi:M3 family metallopeptidase [Granulicella sp. dw_53]|uniref:M3 family metallopeptidase n=1 Tax=Granulicella sp. dw_53 TaxID=2719792 RepID=UPI001BD2AC1D|nr:M3 family metallopeptidase [Granulicella sp. dw_53]